MAFGLDSTGLTIKRLVDIISSLETRLKAQFGDHINLAEDGVFGGLVTSFSPEFNDVWEALQAVYDSFVKGNAEGVQLDNLADLIGITRLGATSSTAAVLVTGVFSTVIPIDSLVTDQQGNDWRFIAQVIIGTGPTAGVVQAVESGEIEAAAGTIDTIKTVIAGWSTVVSSADAVPGRDRETDAELRLRITTSGAVVGSSTVGAIFAKLSELDDAEYVLVIENDTDVTDGDGRPPHSFESIVYPASVPGPDIADVILENKPIGIATYGTQTETVYDDQGLEKEIKFTYGSLLAVKWNVVLEYDPDLYPDDGDSQITDFLEAYTEALGMGVDVTYYGGYTSFAYHSTDDTGVPGVVSITTFQLAKKGDPFGVANISVDHDELPYIQVKATDITVTSSEA